MWPGEDFPALMEYVRARWRYAEDGYFQKDGTHIYRLSTAGWSGNESIIGALQDNQIFWLLCWQESKRGGHYKFSVPKIKAEQKRDEAHEAPA